VTIEQQEESAWRPAGELTIVLDRGGVLRHFELGGALLRSLTRVPAGKLDEKKILRSVRRALRTVITGIDPMHEVTPAQRGDGVQMTSVVIFAVRTRSSYLRSLHVDLTTTGQVVFRYSNDW